jgi:hypothetical protein
MAKWGEGQLGANTKGRKGGFGGRMLALHVLDKMLARRKKQSTLLRALEDEFDRDTIGFFKSIIMPLLPKEAKLTLDHDTVMEWKSLVGPGGPAELLPSAPAADQVIDVPVVAVDTEVRIER